ncbi:MAG: aminotransferase class V-fold PLP-dependent enzyme [Sphingosinicella sp.]
MATSRRTFMVAMGTASLASFGAANSAWAQRPAATGFAPGLIYLNTGSLGPTPQPVLDRVMEVWRALEENPVTNAYGGPALAAAEAARKRAAAYLGCAVDELLITYGTTDAMNIVAGSVRLSPGEVVLTTDQEHHGGTTGWTYRARRDGVRIERIPVPFTETDAGTIVARFAAAIRPETRVISVSHVLFSTGLRMPVAEVAALARERGLLCVVDGAQAIGMVPVDVRADGCHAYAASGHKWLMGPKGTGLLYVSPDAVGRIEPMRWELGRNYVSGSTGMGPLPLVAGLGAAIEAAQAIGMVEIERRVLALRERLWRELSRIPRVTMASPPPGPLASGLIAIRLPDEIEARTVSQRLRDQHGIIARGIPREWFNGLRFSTHIFNTEREIESAVTALRVQLAESDAP